MSKRKVKTTMFEIAVIKKCLEADKKHRQLHQEPENGTAEWWSYHEYKVT